MKWYDAGKTQDLVFYGGLFAVHQHPDGAMEARTGWAVIEAPKPVRKVCKPRVVPPIANARESAPVKRATVRIPVATKKGPRRAKPK
jgi:hypothetical protein